MMERLFDLVKRFKISKNNLHLVVGVMIGLTLTFGGYGLVKNIKSEQSAQAEQLPGTPDSGVKSRITELYDALVAQNKGSDTDVSGLIAAPGDWGPKWNRIKTAALKGTGGSYGQLGYGLSSDPQVNFVDNITGKEWSFPLYRDGSQVKAGFNETDINKLKWSWDASGPNNQAVGNKTASQLCQALGGGWRLPTKDELLYVSDSLATRAFAKHSIQGRWSSSEHESNPQYAWYVRWSDGLAHYATKTFQGLVSCVR